MGLFTKRGRVWEIVATTSNGYGDNRDALLADGWEPFSVAGGRIYMRRLAAPKRTRRAVPKRGRQVPSTAS